MTAVSTEVTPRRAIGELPPEIQQALELRKSRNLVAAQIAGMSWGEKIDGDTRRAVAAWGQQFRVDVTTEIHVLGGRVYLNAAYYLRRLGELIASDIVEYAVADHVEDDPRLKEMGPDGEGEYSRRLKERIMHAVPDKALSAVVFRVKLRTMDREVIGVKWCGGGTRKSDPVGDGFPVESSESRAARRAMRLLVSHVPPETRDAIEVVDRTAALLSDRVAESRKQIKAREAWASAEPGAVGQSSDPADPYQLGAGPVSEAGEARSQSQSPQPASTTPPVSAPISDDAPSAAPVPTPSAGFKMPFAFGEAKVATPLRNVTTGDLRDARTWAMKNGRFGEFVEAAGIELDDRTNAPELGV